MAALGDRSTLAMFGREFECSPEKVTDSGQTPYRRVTALTTARPSRLPYVSRPSLIVIYGQSKTPDLAHV